MPQATYKHTTPAPIERTAARPRLSRAAPRAADPITALLRQQVTLLRGLADSIAGRPVPERRAVFERRTLRELAANTFAIAALVERHDAELPRPHGRLGSTSVAA